MAVSKRLRFEILRRDNHTCRYCGRSAPEVRLTVDHVVPSTLGGQDVPENLVAACTDCNNGKSSANPDADLVANVAGDALRWAEAQKVAEAQLRDQLWARRDNWRDFEDRWAHITAGAGINAPLPAGWESTIDQLMSAGLSMLLIADCAFTAVSINRVSPADKFRYMCGVAWRRVTTLNDIARAVVSDSAVGTKAADPEPPILEMADQAIEDILDVFGATREMHRYASDAMWSSVAAGAQAFEKAVESGDDPAEEALEVAYEEASSVRAFCIYNLSQLAKQREEA